MALGVQLTAVVALNVVRPVNRPFIVL